MIRHLRKKLFLGFASRVDVWVCVCVWIKFEKTHSGMYLRLLYCWCMWTLIVVQLYAYTSISHVFEIPRRSFLENQKLQFFITKQKLWKNFELPKHIIIISILVCFASFCFRFFIRCQSISYSRGGFCINFVAFYPYRLHSVPVSIAPKFQLTCKIDPCTYTYAEKKICESKKKHFQRFKKNWIGV